MNWESDGNGGFNVNVQKKALKKHGTIWGLALTLLTGGAGYTAVDGYQAIQEGGVRKAELDQIKVETRELKSEFKEFKLDTGQKLDDLDEQAHENHQEVLRILLDMKGQ